MISSSTCKPVASSRAFKPFSAHCTNAVKSPTRISRHASSGRTPQQTEPLTPQEGHQNKHHALAQRLFSAALAASVMLSSDAAVAIGPVSVKLEELQISKTDCGGEFKTKIPLLFSWTALTTWHAATLGHCSHFNPCDVYTMISARLYAQLVSQLLEV